MLDKRFRPVMAQRQVLSGGVECTALQGRASERGYRVLSTTAATGCGTLMFSVMQVLHEMPELLDPIARS
jgi:hypothetical protein